MLINTEDDVVPSALFHKVSFFRIHIIIQYLLSVQIHDIADTGRGRTSSIQRDVPCQSLEFHTRFWDQPLQLRLHLLSLCQMRGRAERLIVYIQQVIQLDDSPIHRPSCVIDNPLKIPPRSMVLVTSEPTH